MSSDNLGILPKDLEAAARALVTSKAPAGVTDDTVNVEISRSWTIEPNENFGLVVHARHKAFGRNGIHAADERKSRNPAAENLDTHIQVSTRVWFPVAYVGGEYNEWRDHAFYLVDAAYAAHIGSPIDLESYDKVLRRDLPWDEADYPSPLRSDAAGGAGYLDWIIGRLESGEGLALDQIRLTADSGVTFDGNGRVIALPMSLSLKTAKAVLDELGDETFIGLFGAGILRAGRGRGGETVVAILRGHEERPRFMSDIKIGYGSRTLDDIIKPKLDPRPFAPARSLKDPETIVVVCRSELEHREPKHEGTRDAHVHS